MDDKAVWAVIFVFAVTLFLMVGGVIWWHVNYTCVESHQEEQFRTQCSTHNKHTTCHTYPATVTVCDQWEER